VSLFHSILSQIQQKISSRHADMDMVASTISSVLGVVVMADQISLRNKVLTITAQPTVKLAVRLKQQALIAALTTKGVPVSVIR
jgi:hypothetical protein